MSCPPSGVAGQQSGLLAGLPAALGDRLRVGGVHEHGADDLRVRALAADVVSDAPVRPGERRRPDAAPVRAGAEDHVVLRLPHHLQAQPQDRVGGDAGGQGLGVGALGGQQQHDAGGGAALDEVGADLLELAPVLGVLEPDLALVDPDDDRVQPQGLGVGELAGDLRLRADVPGQRADHLRAPAAAPRAVRAGRRSRTQCPPRRPRPGGGDRPCHRPGRGHRCPSGRRCEARPAGRGRRSAAAGGAGTSCPCAAPRR